MFSDLRTGCVYQIPNLPSTVVFFMIHDKLLIAFGGESFKFLTCQLSMVRVLTHHDSDG